MLEMIKCETFDETHKTITFEPGLNAILGSGVGSNSIGKTTLLLIIDFCFGGDGYVKLAKDVFRAEHVGDHRIDFCFRFKGVPYYFSRKTEKDGKRVEWCNAEFEPIRGMGMDIGKFRSWLKNQYGLDFLPFGFKTVTERFFRIFGKENANPKEVLSCKDNEPKQINFLMEILECPETLRILDSKSAEVDLDWEKIDVAKIKTDYSGQIEEKVNEIIDEESRLQEQMAIYKNAQAHAYSFDDEADEKKREIQQRVRELGQKRSTLLSQQKAIENSKEHTTTDIVSDFKPLLRYFPNANTKELSAVEHFHKKMSEYLHEGIQTEIERLKPIIRYYDSEFQKYKARLEDAVSNKDVANSTFTECVRISARLEVLSADLEKLKEDKAKQDERDANEAEIRELCWQMNSVLENVRTKINEKMREVSAIITAEAEHPPRLQKYAGKKFELTTPENRSYGALFKSLVTFDLALLELTAIPVIIHDSNVLAAIEIPYLNNIIAYYVDHVAARGRQVFIALDKADKYSNIAQALLEQAKRVQLSDEHRLYAVPSWTKTK